MSRGRAKNQAQRFHEPLINGDSAERTVGCRHTNPDICAKHMLASVCAFVRADGMCFSPAASWPKQYEKLLQLHRTSKERE